MDIIKKMSLLDYYIQDGNLLKLFFSTASVYALYYFYKVVHRPCLVGRDGEFKSMLQTNLHILKEHYWPTFWAFTSHFQTICRVILKSKPFVPYRREILTTEDGGHIAIDWVDNDVDNTKYPNHKTRPIVFIMPGITGCRNSSYIRHIAIEAKNLGCRVIVFNNRGLGEISLKTPRLFSACNGEDLELVLNYVSKQHPDCPIIMYAVSLGGMTLSNYLVDTSDIKANIIASMVVSVPWDCYESSISMEKPINRILYNRHLVNNMHEIIKKNWNVFQDHLSELPYKLEDVLKASTMSEFDDVFTSPAFGFASVKEYFQQASLSYKPLENIQTPVLFLAARDDPFAPLNSIPLESIHKNKNLALILTDYGGHIGFTEGLAVRDRSFVERMFSQYVECMLSNNNNSDVK